MPRFARRALALAACLALLPAAAQSPKPAAVVVRRSIWNYLPGIATVIAFGLDRMVAMLAGVEQIRDVMAFPKTQRGQDLMVDTPTPVTEKQLRELHIRLRNVQVPA